VAVRAPASHDRDRLGVPDGEPEPARLTCLDGLTGSASTRTQVLGVVALLDGGMLRSEPGVAGGRRPLSNAAGASAWCPCAQHERPTAAG
jgi:hypothetical protein